MNEITAIRADEQKPIDEEATMYRSNTGHPKKAKK